MKSIKGIQKITKAVYMIASARLRKAVARLEAARAFAAPLEEVWKTPAPKEGQKAHYLLVPITSDRGLCGGFNASVIREAKRVIPDLLKAHPSASILSYGEKAKLGLERMFRDRFSVTVTDTAKLPARTFKQTGIIADFISKANFDVGHIISNRFKNMMAFETQHIPLANKQAWLDNQYEALMAYEVEGTVDGVENLVEYRNAVQLWHQLVETDTSELVARMNAMQGASSNISELMGVLQLQYNKSRQARITNELVEVISGAIAAEEGHKKRGGYEGGSKRR
jgi:ATP synthase F1 gamma subunit